MFTTHGCEQHLCVKYVSTYRGARWNPHPLFPSSKAKQVAMSGKLASNCAILTRLQEFPPLIIEPFQSGMRRRSPSAFCKRAMLRAINTQNQMAIRTAVILKTKMAEREGFEPPIPVKVCPLSRRIVSTAHAPLRVGFELKSGRMIPSLS